MPNKLYEETSVQDIADALRLKKDGADTTYKISEMSGGVLDSPFAYIPSYHTQEAGRVIKRILDLKTMYPNHIVFGAISDNHVDMTNTDVLTSARHAAFALESVGTMAGCDFVANLGDNISGDDGIDGAEDYADAVYMENTARYVMTSQTAFNLIGNHDKSNSTEKLYNLVGKYNDFDVSGTTQIRGYGYKDFEDKKVRAIVLNTTDYWNIVGGNGMSYEQKYFLMRSIDLSDKDDSAEWLILILSHIPLDYLGGDYNKGADLKAILKAYSNGGAVSIAIDSTYAYAQNESDKYSGTLTYNYAGKNSAKIINIHGHLHNNATGKLIYIDDNTELDIVRIATPNSSYNGNKSTNRYPDRGDYSITAEEAAKIAKSADSAKDTSATFYFIDLTGQVVYAVGYGADIDRVISYKDIPVYTITYSMTGVTSSNTANSAIEGADYTTTLMPDTDYEIVSVTVTMGGTDVTSTVYSNGVITIGAVTGDVVITITAKDNYVPHWDIADRTAVTNMYRTADTTKELSRKNYYWGTARAGQIDYRMVTACTLNGNDVTFTGTTKNTGIGLPYHLEAGATYTFSATASASGRIGKYVYNADGTYVSGSTKYSSSGTNLTVTFEAPEDETQWVILQVECYTVNTSITYSNITLTKNA